jgi:acetate kinase
MRILVANIGSTSFKFRLYEMTSGRALAEGREERIGRGGPCPDYATAIEGSLRNLVGPERPLRSLSDLAAVGFKAVLARGTSGAVRVDEAVLRAMEDYQFLAPAHNPPYVAAMRAFGEVAPQVPRVALFETAFFDGLAPATTAYAVPHEWKDSYLVRRRGFHGASHRYASERAMALVSKRPLRHVSCHLGGSSSLAAVRDGKAIDVSFGMSPQSGLPQNNRAGDLDVFAVLYMMKTLGLSVDQTAEILASRSGLAGLSGLSGEIPDLEREAEAGDARARLALDVFVAAVRHYLGAFLLTLGGLDVLTFSGGIGERGGRIRRAVCAGLEGFGIRLAKEQPEVCSAETRLSSGDSSVEVLVIPANEEWIVARAAAEVVSGKPPALRFPANG